MYVQIFFSGLCVEIQRVHPQRATGFMNLKKLVVHLPGLDNRLLISLSANKLFILAILAHGLCIIKLHLDTPTVDVNS